MAAICLVLFLFAGGLFARDSGSARVPAGFWGVDPQETPTAAEFARMARGGVDSVRYRMDWAYLEPSPGNFIWNDFDAIVTGTARHHMRALPVLIDAPAWLTGGSTHLPIETGHQRRVWKRFIEAAVKRYGPHGEFWSEHGRGSADPLPYEPIRAWQIWNEENFFYFSEPPSPSNYAELLRLAHRVIADLDPKAKIVLGGLFADPSEGPPRAFDATDFLRRLYRVKGVRKLFDGVALHPYAKNAGVMKADIEQLRAVMRSHGDGQTSVWLTELGWGSGHGTAFEKGLRGQVRQLKQAFRIIRRNRRRWHIRSVYWYAWRDIQNECTFCDSIGLFTVDNNPKPAWFEFVKFTGGKP